MAVKLGLTPEQLTVILTRDADFVAVMRRSDGTPWESGVELSLDFGTAGQWPATLTADKAEWQVDAAVVNTLLDARPRGVRLWYVNGTTKLLWASGSIDKRS